MARSRRRFLLVFAGALVAPAVLACNALIGLDDYEKVPCTGAKCGDATTDDVIQVDAPNDQTGIDVKIDAQGTSPVSWAHFKMPHYPDASVDANEQVPERNLLSFDVAVGGLQDHVTQLVWMEPMPSGSIGLTWDKARTFCSSQTKDGPWRLPSRIELVTLLDYSKTGSKFDAKFTGTQEAVYWTTSEVRTLLPSNARKHWGVNFGTGAVTNTLDEATGVAAVRCVKGGK
jgi:hypothetical protein